MHDGFLTAFENKTVQRREQIWWLAQANHPAQGLKPCSKQRKKPMDELKEEQLEETYEEEITLTGEQTATLEVALNQLKGRYRTALVLMYLEGYDYDELSEILKLSYGNCRTSSLAQKHN